MINVSVAGTSAVLIPSTARSATADSAGLLKLASLCALDLVVTSLRAALSLG